MHIKKDDIVQVITGDDKDSRGRVLRVIPAKNKIVVEGVGRAYKHLKPSRQNPQGGRLSKEMPIDVSNVMLVDPQTNAPTRVGVRYTSDGRKERYSKSTGGSLGAISPPREAYAKEEMTNF